MKERSGISGTTRWSIDSEGVLLFEPAYGEAGALSEMREWQFCEDNVTSIKTDGVVFLPENCRGLFSFCTKMKSFDGIDFDTSYVTDMNHMFMGCSSLTELDLSSFDTHKVTDMGDMFTSCSRLKSINLSSFDTNKVKDMCGMFCECKNLEELDLSLSLIHI